MPHPQSLLAELRALEAKQGQGSLSAGEQARLAELRAVAGPPPAARGFDVNAAAAAIRDSLVPAGYRGARAADAPVPLPPPDVGALGPRTPPVEARPVEPEEVEPLPPEELAPPPGIDVGPPAGYDLTPPSPPPPEGEPATQGYDVVPAFDASGAAADADPNAAAQWDPSAPVQWDPNAAAPVDPNAAAQWDPSAPAQWDPNAAAPVDPNAAAQWDPSAPAQWDPNAAAPVDPNAAAQWDPSAPAQWDPNAAAPVDPNAAAQWDPSAAAQWDPNAPAQWDQNAAAQWDPGAATQWDARAPSAPSWEPAPGADAGAERRSWDAPAPGRRPDHDTASWDLSGAAAPALAMPDEGDPGATAVWSVAQIAAASPAQARPEGSADEVEPVFLDEMQLESEGSFAFREPPGAASDPWLARGPEAEPAPAPAGGEAPEPPRAGPDAELSPVEPAPPRPQAGPSLGLGAPPAPEPEIVSDDQIIEVGTDVIEVGEADDIPTVDAVELVDEEVPAAGPEGALAAPGAAAPEEAPPIPAAEAPAPAPEAPALEAAPPAAEAPSAGEEGLAAPPQAEAQAEAGAQPAPEDEIPLVEDLPAPPPVPEPRAEAAAPPEEPVPLESLTIEEAPLVEPQEPPFPARRILEGLHRVVVHTTEGQVKRGSLSDPDLAASELILSPQPSGAPEALPADRVRAIFFMLGAGEKPPAPEGVKVRVTFKDGRQVAGFSPDYEPDAGGFFMIPADTRTNTARIWVYRGAVRQVTVS